MLGAAAALSPILFTSAKVAAMSAPLPSSNPIVIAHRGASGERPEHTLAAYKLGIEQGADFIEPDLVPTKDAVLVCRHDAEISTTTDVATREAFAGRRTTRLVDGTPVNGWFVEDFTLEELKTLRARERLPQLRPSNIAFDGQETIPTFAEVIQLVQAESERTGRTIGVYPELKHPGWFGAHGIDVAALLVRDLRAHGLDRKDSPVFVQCFEPATLKRVRAELPVRLVQLIAAGGSTADTPPTRYAAMVKPEGLAAIAAYADAIGPDKGLVIARNADGTAAGPTSLVKDAHAAGLLVHPFTYRAENAFLPMDLRRGTDVAHHGDLGAELAQAFAAGVDGLFTDFPGQAVAARAVWMAKI